MPAKVPMRTPSGKIARGYADGQAGTAGGSHSYADNKGNKENDLDRSGYSDPYGKPKMVANPGAVTPKHGWNGSQHKNTGSQ